MAKIVIVLHALTITIIYLLLFRKGIKQKTAGISPVIWSLFILYSISIIINSVQLTALLFGFHDQLSGYIKLLTIGIFTAVNYAVIILISIDRLFYQSQVAQKRNNEMIRFKQLSEIDALTGLANRRAVESEVYAQLKKAENSGLIFTVFMIDVNSFKRINDLYGHDTGDAVLIKFANILKNQIRKDDIIGRWGGDEFIIISMGTDKRTAQEVNTRFIELVFSVTMENDNNTIPVSISSGFGTYQQSDTVDTIVKRADIMLYDIKREKKK